MTAVNLKDVVAKKLAGWAKSRVIRDYDEFCMGKPIQSALLSYLSCRFCRHGPFRNRVKFSNRGIAQEIPRSLNELGYSVDIVNYDNRSWFPTVRTTCSSGRGDQFRADLPAPLGSHRPDLFRNGDLLEGVEREYR